MFYAARQKIAGYLRHEAAGGILLMVAAGVALLLNNSPFSSLYDSLLSVPVVVQVGALEIDKPLLLWINDGLMAVFFFVVGLEIKREILEGQLATWKQASLPAIAATGGMVIPALIFIVMNWGDSVGLRGWAIPSATDIAFALGVIALLGKRVPVSLKVFLLALAIIDDLGAIVIIAAFYTADLSLTSLGIGAVGAALLFAMNALGLTRIAPYLVVGIVMWICVLKSGVHATLAGVVIALAIPLRARDTAGRSPLHHLEVQLLPLVSFGIMPIFAFANAGVSLAGLSLTDILAPVPLGIALGLFLGKQVGVLGFSLLGCKLGVCRLPAGVSWAQVYGVAILAGIGFTMSLFIGTLAYVDPAYAKAVRVGVIAGSTLSAITGYCLLRWLSSASGVRRAETVAAS